MFTPGTLLAPRSNNVNRCLQGSTDLVVNIKSATAKATLTKVDCEGANKAGDSDESHSDGVARKTCNGFMNAPSQQLTDSNKAIVSEKRSNPNSERSANGYCIPEGSSVSLTFLRPYDFVGTTPPLQRILAVARILVYGLCVNINPPMWQVEAIPISAFEFNHRDPIIEIRGIRFGREESQEYERIRTNPFLRTNLAVPT